jgi:ABC-2 type transport system permease protein
MVLEKFAAALAGLAGLMLVLWLAATGLGAAAGMGLSAGNTGATMLHLGLLGAEFTALAMLAGAVTGRLAVSRAVPALIAVTAYLVNGFAQTVHWLQPVRKVSPFYQYLGHDPIRHGLSTAAVGISVVSIAVLIALAVLAFRRRDIG